MLVAQRWVVLLSLLACTLVFLFYLRQGDTVIKSHSSVVLDHHEGIVGKPPEAPSAGDKPPKPPSGGKPKVKEPTDDGHFHWEDVPQHYPVSSFVPVPTGHARSLPRIQYSFKKETDDERALRRERQAMVLGNFTHSWRGYKEHAWLKDEVGPLSGKPSDTFGGWAASLVDGLDTLWIMGLKDEFEDAVAAIRTIDFSSCALGELNVFETTIRYMGGLLGAHDLTNGKYPILLKKATELGEMVYKAFDTPNRMPITRWKFQDAKSGMEQVAPQTMLIAELGSLTLELTRLSQLTGEDKYYDAVKRVMDQLEDQQQTTKLPGLFPILVNPQNLYLNEGDLFTLGGMVDSVYEYLPKMHLLFGGATDQYKMMYQNAMIPIQKSLIFRPMTDAGDDIRIAGQATVDRNNDVHLDPQAQHLTCFVGGMVALGSRAFEEPGKTDLGRQLTDGCIWGYEVMPRGIMPEIMHTVPCPYANQACEFDDSTWHSAVSAMAGGGPMNLGDEISKKHLPRGVSSVDDTRYGLRPEAIESVFVLYRITGDKKLLDKAWMMFESIVKHTSTEIGAAALKDCVNPDYDSKTDRMESYWFAETLKYFYLIFSEPDVVSLDEFVLNTEAHPFRYRK